MIEQNISSLIKSQFPSIYQDESTDFILFVQKYFEWLEQEGNVLNKARNLLTYQDIDTTVDEYLIHFKEKYVKNIQFDIATNERELVKHSLDLHRSKGSERSFELFFKLVYGQDCDIYYPSRDIFKTSDNTWNREKYVEIQPYSNAKELVGKQVYGGSSNAVAYVEKYIRRKSLDNTYNDLLYLTNIEGDFLIGDPILSVNEPSYVNNPVIQGSVVGVTVTSGGALFSTGDIVTIESETSNNAIGRVTQIHNRSGSVDFTYVDGGWGYSDQANVWISDYTFFLNQFKSTGNTYISTLDLGYVYRSNVVFNSSNTDFAEGQTASSNGVTGRILEVDQSGSNGYIVIGRLDPDPFPTSGSVTVSNGSANIVSSNEFTAEYISLENTNIVKLEMVNESLGDSIKRFDTITQGDNSGIVSNILKNVLYITNISGTFNTSNNIVVTRTGSAYAVNSISSEIRVDIRDGYLYSQGSPDVIFGNTSGQIDNYTTGLNAGFGLGDLEDTELVWLNDDLLENYKDVPLDAVAYGFPNDPSANASTIIKNALSYNERLIGTFVNIKEISPGSGYTNAPKALVIDQEVQALKKKDIKLYIQGANSAFILGETVYQDNIINVQDVQVANSAAFFEHEYLMQAGNPIGEISDIDDDVLRIFYYTANVNPASNVYGSISNTSSAVTSVSFNPYNDVVKGEVKGSAGEYLVYVARRNLMKEFSPGKLIHGEYSLATANVMFVETDYTSNVAGLNSTVDTNVNNNEGSVQKIDVISSGYGYSNAESVRLVSNNAAALAAEGIIIKGGVGSADGYFYDRSGFLSDYASLFDGEYYQEYSYEVRSTLPIEKYQDILKKVLHVAGTKMFGKVVIRSDIEVDTDTESSVESMIDSGIMNFQIFGNPTLTLFLED